MNHKAIYALYPTVVTFDDGAGAFDAQGNKVAIDEAAVAAWVDPQQYKYDRQPHQRPQHRHRHHRQQQSSVQ